MTLSRMTSDFEALDLLFKNMFNQESFFAPVLKTKMNHPVDIWEDKESLNFAVAGTGLSKEDIEIQIEGDVLKISHTKRKDDNVNFIYRSISNKSFQLAYKIPSKFNLDRAIAKMENGLLTIRIPFAEEEKPKTLEIN